MTGGFGDSVYVGRPQGLEDADCEDAFLVDFAGDVAAAEVREQRRDGRVCHIVAERWRPIGDDFGQQLLNRRFAARLLAGPPKRVCLPQVHGATIDIAKLAALFGVAVELGHPEIEPCAGRPAAWWSGVERLCAEVGGGGGQPGPVRGYEAYAFSQRDHALLYDMQRPLVRHFKACSSVLDIGCGTGLFLEALNRAGHRAVGVERNALSARYARGLGHEVFEQGAFEYLDGTERRFDGVYCSHFVEHLPIDAVEGLIARIATVLSPGGCAVFVFPDPESIRSQLLGFWRDPEHVRFYHPDLVAMIGAMYGLECEFNSQKVPGRRVVPFAMEPPLEARPENPASCEAGEAERNAGIAQRLCKWFGIGSARLRALEVQVKALEARLARAERREQESADAIRRLWEVNQTWAWDDNAILRLRKST